MDKGDGVAADSVTWPTMYGRTATSPATWRLRVRMDDRPGTLARLAIRLADLGCNVLGLSVIPLPDGVLDEIVVRPPAGLTGSELVAALRAEGCDCTTVAEADVRDLVDPATATLVSAARAINEPTKWADVMREVLAADMVTVVPVSEANPARTEGGHRAAITVGAKAVVLRRQWAAFTDVELSRANALLGLLTAAEANIAAPSVVTCDDGASVVLRVTLRPCRTCTRGAPWRRCSTGTTPECGPCPAAGCTACCSRRAGSACSEWSGGRRWRSAS